MIFIQKILENYGSVIATITGTPEPSPPATTKVDRKIASAPVVPVEHPPAVVMKPVPAIEVVSMTDCIGCSIPSS
jgi:hypothetical protein